MEQKSLFNPKEFYGSPNDKIKEKKKSVKQIKKEKDAFLKELIENRGAEPKEEEKAVNEEMSELEKLNEELEKDAQEGLLVDEPFFIEHSKLIVRRFQNQIHPNLKQLAKSVIDSKWEQNINIENITIKHEVLENDVYSYESVVCVNKYGVRFNVILTEILEKLNKIPFE